MRQQPHRTGRRALAAFGIWRRVVEIAIDVENMNVLSRNTHECLSRSHHNAAIATDQQRDLPGQLQVWPGPRIAWECVRGPGQLLIGGIE